MRRRPCERAGDRRPADQHREAAGDAAPDDVLGGAALQPERVDEHVEADRRHREHGREPGGEGEQPDGRGEAERPGEDERLPGRQLPRDQGTVAGALHHAVDVTVDVAVERRGAAGAHRPADHRGGDQPEARDAALGQDHHRDGRDEQQLHDARLGQREVGEERPTRPDRQPAHRFRRGDPRRVPGRRHPASDCRSWPPRGERRRHASRPGRNIRRPRRVRYGGQRVGRSERDGPGVLRCEPATAPGTSLRRTPSRGSARSRTTVIGSGRVPGLTMTRAGAERSARDE